MADKIEGKYLYYKGRPLVREGSTICYGDKTEKCFLILEIMSYKEDHGVQVPENIIVQIVDSKDSNKIIKQANKVGLFDAFTFGVEVLEYNLK